MKNSILIKFLAFVIAVFTLVGAVVSALSVGILCWLDLYSAESYEQWQTQQVEDRASQLAYRMVQNYMIENHSDLPYALCEDLLWTWNERDYESWIGLHPDSYSYAIADSQGVVLTSAGGATLQKANYTFTLSVTYPVRTTNADGSDLWYYDDQSLYVTHIESPEYTVAVCMNAGSMTTYNGIPVVYLDILFSLRYWLIVALTGSLLVFAGSAVYLCYVAGRKARSEEIAPGALNKVPLDVYLAASGGICILLAALAWLILDEWVIYESVNAGALALVVLILLVAATAVIGFFFALSAQAKMGKTYWIRHTLIGFLCILLFKGIRFLVRSIIRLISLMPMIWQYMLGILTMGFAVFFAAVIRANSGTGFAAFFLAHTILACLGLICYGGYALGTIFKGAKAMRQGNLQDKINTRYLIGSYKKAAEDLNALADAAKLAAERQLKSERMKTELITNVSHDIKTPLTSIINYVDLLEKPHTEQEAQQYLEVLGRQSQRLKKLVDDLMDMSKATTGNMTVEITCLDAVETVNQALGEFADKLAAAALTPVLRCPEEAVAIYADGRLVWRVLSNLLSNIVKYALPGTRVYMDVCQSRSGVQISLKNISREPLNISAEELKERFVRGDAARNTEGSGLGLNITQSLMELQKGSLDLLVDGDLFKVTLTFPS